jgi:hypothetical protein
MTEVEQNAIELRRLNVMASHQCPLKFPSSELGYISHRSTAHSLQVKGLCLSEL